MVLGLIPVGKLVTCSNHLGVMRNQNLFPLSIKYSHSFAWVLGSDNGGRWTPWPPTGLRQNHDVPRPSRIADFKTSISFEKVAQFAAGSISSRARLFLERRRQCKNTRVRKISKQKHLREVITIKRKRFHQVKIMNPFPLNKIFHIDYKLAKEGLIYNQLQNSQG